MTDYMRLKNQIGKAFDYDRVNACMIDDIDAGTEIDSYEEIKKVINDKGSCSLFKVYYDVPESICYDVWVTDTGIISAIEIEDGGC